MIIYRPVRLTSVLGKIMEQFILSGLSGHVKDNQGIRPSQRGFMKGRSCLTNLIFYDQVTRLVGEGKAVGVPTRTLVRPLALFPTASSWRNQLPMVWMGVLFPG